MVMAKQNKYWDISKFLVSSSTAVQYHANCLHHSFVDLFDVAIYFIFVNLGLFSGQLSSVFVTQKSKMH